MATVYLIRHARTASNREGRYMGWIDESVDPGEAPSIIKLTDRLADENIAGIYSSPLARARETAAPLAARLGLGVDVRTDLAELRMGSWEGLTQTEIAAKWPAEWRTWRSDPAALEMVGRESLCDLGRRVGRCLDEIVRESGSASIAVFAHDTVIRVGLLHMLDLPLTRYRSIEAFNCSISALKVENSICKLLLGQPD